MIRRRSLREGSTSRARLEFSPSPSQLPRLLALPIQSPIELIKKARPSPTFTPSRRIRASLHFPNLDDIPNGQLLLHDSILTQVAGERTGSPVAHSTPLDKPKHSLLATIQTSRSHQPPSLRCVFLSSSPVSIPPHLPSSASPG